MTNYLTASIINFSSLRARRNISLIAMLLPALLLSGCQQAELSEREKKRLISLGIHTLPAAEDVSNRYFNDPSAQSFGEQLFFDKRLSASGTVSCASCHIPEKNFTDGLPRAEVLHNHNANLPAMRNTPTVVGSAWSQWQYWDGRRDSLWSQALTPIEAPAEMASNRIATAKLVLNDTDYLTQYRSLFNPVALSNAQLSVEATPMGGQQAKRQWYKLDKPVQTKINRVFANVGKSIAAYQATLRPPQTKFDEFILRLANNEPYRNILTDQEYAGARLFVNEKKTQCLECHNGALLSNTDFHNIGSATLSGDHIDFGRVFGVQAAMIDEFNCHGRYSDAANDQCLHLKFMNQADIIHTQGGFKTPTLRNVANTAPYFHDGRFTTLRQVINHYLTVHLSELQTEIRPFSLTDKEIDQLIAFLRTLTPLEAH